MGDAFRQNTRNRLDGFLNWYSRPPPAMVLHVRRVLILALKLLTHARPDRLEKECQIHAVVRMFRQHHPPGYLALALRTVDG